MITNHIDQLLKGDKFFKAFWFSIDTAYQQELLNLTQKINKTTKLDNDDLLSKHNKASERLRRYLSCIPEKDLDYSRRPKDWPEFTADEKAKRALYRRSDTTLKRFLKAYLEEGSVRHYGGIKPLESLDQTLGRQKSSKGTRRWFRDTWDVVRFRIVAKNVLILRKIATEIWQYYVDDIIKCRNYYFNPRESIGSDPYRALHFEIEIVPQRWIEVQLLSEARDWIGFLDYPFLFKKTLSFQDKEHRIWLEALSLKTNLYDDSRVPANAVGNVLDSL